MIGHVEAGKGEVLLLLLLLLLRCYDKKREMDE